MNNLAIVYVLYNTNIDLLNRSIESLEKSIPKSLCVKFFIHNNSNYDLLHKLRIKSEFQYYYDSINIGLAAAQNKIIKENLTTFDYFLTSDQDSIYSANYLENGINYLQQQAQCGCVVPVWRNIYSNKDDFEGQIILHQGRLKMIKPDDLPEDNFQVTHAISSGSIIKAETFYKIGFFNEDFFIDWIDNEWMWRAYESEISIMCYKKLQIIHQWGDAPTRILNVRIPKKSEVRIYFTFRNGLALIFHKELNYIFKHYILIQLSKYLIYLIFSFNIRKYKKLYDAVRAFKKIEFQHVAK